MATAPPAYPARNCWPLVHKNGNGGVPGDNSSTWTSKNGLTFTESEYLEMIRLKTAVLLGCALKMGAMIGGATSQDAELLYDFGINIGLAFQLKDDLLDVYGDPRTFGKNIGGDIVCNKKTYLLIKALKTSRGSQHEELQRWIAATQFDREEKIASVKNIYNDLNLRAISENLIEKYYLAALDALSSILISDERKKELVSLAKPDVQVK